MATGGTGIPKDELTRELSKFIQDRDKPDTKVQAIVGKSYAKAQVERKHSADADDLSRQDKEKKLNRMLQKQRHRRQRKSRLTVSDVRTEAAKILEEFLQSQLHEQSIQTKANERSHRYQRYMEVDIAEETTHSGESTGYFASHSTLEREESIPFADDSDAEQLQHTVGSLPQDDMLISMYSKKRPEIIHGKSRSAPYKGPMDSMLPPAPPRKFSGLRPPPPPPPGTPFSPSDASGSKESISYVPYTGFGSENGTQASSGSLDWIPQGPGLTDSKTSFPSEHVGSSDKFGSHTSVHSHHKVPQPSEHVGHNEKLGSDTSVHSRNKVTQPKVPTSLDLPSPPRRSTTPCSETGSKSSSATKSLGARSKTVMKSGSISSSETDSETSSHLKDRKKKPFYKKAQERLHSLLRKQKDHSPDRDADVFKSNDKSGKKKLKKKHKKDKKLDDDDHFDRGDSPKTAKLENRHIHISKHIHQTHPGGNGDVVIRTEEINEVMDVVSDSERKHKETHLKVKESAEGGKGFLGKIRRMTSKERGKKKIKGSKSAEFEERGRRNVQYNPMLSVPGDTLDDEDGISVTHIERKNDHEGQSTVKARQVVDRRNDMKRHSSHLDILNHDGSFLERVYFDEGNNDLPRNESFDLVEEVFVQEKEVLEDGRVKMIRDVNRHDHMVISNEDLNDEAVGGAERSDLSEMTETEKDEMFGKIAGRLAMIGDNIMSERGESFSPTSASSESKTSPQQSPSPDEEMKRAHLTQLESEIRDELRLVADEIDARLAANARQAAMRIAGVMAYDQFSTVVDEQVNKEVGWAQVAAVFNITKRAIQVAGASGTLAIQIKEMSLKYIEDKFASWIVGQGGWDSMLSGAEDTDSECELD